MTAETFTPGPFDALDKVNEGEPRFVLLGRDPAMPGAITEWARLRRMAAIRKYGTPRSGTRSETKLKAELAQCHEAEEIALYADEWRKGHEEVEGNKPTYNEVKKSEAELAALADHALLDLAHKNLREAAYFLCEATDILKRMGKVDEVEALSMGDLLTRINAKADVIREELGK